MAPYVHKGDEGEGVKEKEKEERAKCKGSKYWISTGFEPKLL